MHITLTRDWDTFVDDAVTAGRFESADAVVAEALRLLRERDDKVAALRQTIQASIARGGSHDEAAVWAAIDRAVALRA